MNKLGYGMNKVLESRRKIVNCTYFRQSDFTWVDHSFNVSPIDIDRIHNCVTFRSRRELPKYKELCISLATDGMLHPLILIENTPDNWDRACLGVEPTYLNTYENKDYLCLVGNQRLDFAIQYKYCLVDSIIVPDFPSMHAAQLILQEGKIVHDKSQKRVQKKQSNNRKSKTRV